MSFTNIVSEEIRKAIVTNKDSECPHWCYRDIWHGDNTEIRCELPNYHEEDLGITTHFSLKGDLAFEGGIAGNLWFKDLSVKDK